MPDTRGVSRFQAKGFMDLIRRHANKFRDQVSKQQQVLSKRHNEIPNYSDSGNEHEMQRHRELEFLYICTTAGKHFQREIVKGIESIISASSKQLESAGKVAHECAKYAREGPTPKGALSEACSLYGRTFEKLRKERESWHHNLGTKVVEPLRTMIMGERLEEARKLCHRYDRMRHEVEAQALEIARRKAKSPTQRPTEHVNRIRAYEKRLVELQSAMRVLGKEAARKMNIVNNQQQSHTLERLIAMVQAECIYHERTLEILHELIEKMGYVFENNESIPFDYPSYSYGEVNPKDEGSNISRGNEIEDEEIFLAEVIYPFEGQGPGELSLKPGDYVAVRQTLKTGWSEGECKGKCGWFPTSHVEWREVAPKDRFI